MILSKIFNKMKRSVCLLVVCFALNRSVNFAIANSYKDQKIGKIASSNAMNSEDLDDLRYNSRFKNEEKIVLFIDCSREKSTNNSI